MSINNLVPRRWAGAMALLILTCVAPSPAWCKSKQSLWISFVAGGGIVSYSSKQLAKSGMPSPNQLSTFATASGLAFDKSKNLWAVINEDEIVRFTAKQLKDLKKDPNPMPGVVITSTATFGQLFGCSFDHEGNLWVANPGNHALYELSKQELDGGSADVTPPVAITSPEMDGSLFVTFDAAGDAWLDSDANDTIVEFSASQLTSGGSKSPNVILSDDGSGSSLDYPGELAFDAKGNLWVANLESETVVEYAKDDLTASGDPAPAVKLSSKIFNGPWGLAFNSKGNLVVMNSFGGTIAEFTPAQIKASGEPVPTVTLTGTVDENYQIIFGPAS